MLWFLLIAAAAFVINVAFLAFTPSCADDDADWGYARSLFGTLSWLRKTLVFVIAVLVSPFLLTFVVLGLIKIVLWDGTICIYGVIRSHRELRNYRDPAFDRPLNASDLNDATRKYFDERISEFFAAGFSMIGTYEYRPSPARCISRYYVADEGRMFGETSCFDSMHETCVTSILADGFVVNCNTMAQKLPVAYRFPRTTTRIKFICSSKPT